MISNSRLVIFSLLLLLAGQTVGLAHEINDHDQVAPECAVCIALNANDDWGNAVAFSNHQALAVFDYRAENRPDSVCLSIPEDAQPRAPPA